VIGDFIKGAVPVFVGILLDFDINIVAAAGLADYMWPDVACIP